MTRFARLKRLAAGPLSASGAAKAPGLNLEDRMENWEERP